MVFEYRNQWYLHKKTPILNIGARTLGLTSMENF